MDKFAELSDKDLAASLIAAERALQIHRQRAATASNDAVELQLEVERRQRVKASVFVTPVAEAPVRRGHGTW